MPVLIIENVQKIGIGMLLFLGAYLSNMGLGAWRNVKISGQKFDWKKILESVLKFAVLFLGLAILSLVVSVVPSYVTYVGIDIGIDTLDTIDSMVIVSAFLTATVRYVMDSIGKIKDILGITSKE